MNTEIANCVERLSPFRYQGVDHIIHRCAMVNGQPVIEVSPENPALVAEFARRMRRSILPIRVEEDRFAGIKFFPRDGRI